MSNVDCTCNMTFNPNTNMWSHHFKCATMQWQPGYKNTQTAVRQRELPTPAERFGEHVMEGSMDPERRKLLVTREQLEADIRKHLVKQTTPLIQLPAKEADATLRTFTTGATRDTDEGKNDYEGFLSPLVLRAYGDYMTEHRIQSDGSLRASDNWQKGIPMDAYMKSLLRHVFDLWLLHRGFAPEPEKRGGVLKQPTKVTLLCSIMFNAMGYLHELLKETAKKAA